MTAPIASGWSGCRVGLAPTGKRRLVTAHANNGLMHRSNFLTFDHLVSTVEQRFGMVRALGHTTFANRLSVRAGTETDFVG